MVTGENGLNGVNVQPPVIKVKGKDFVPVIILLLLVVVVIVQDLLNRLNHAACIYVQVNSVDFYNILLFRFIMTK